MFLEMHQVEKKECHIFLGRVITKVRIKCRPISHAHIYQVPTCHLLFVLRQNHSISMSYVISSGSILSVSLSSKLFTNAFPRVSTASFRPIILDPSIATLGRSIQHLTSLVHL